MSEQTQWPWKIEPYTEAEIEELMKQEPISQWNVNFREAELSHNKILADIITPEPTPEGFTEFSDYETSFAKVKRIMKEGQHD